MHTPGPHSQGETQVGFSEVRRVVLGYPLPKNLLESSTLTSHEATEVQGGQEGLQKQMVMSSSPGTNTPGRGPVLGSASGQPRDSESTVNFPGCEMGTLPLILLPGGGEDHRRSRTSTPAWSRTSPVSGVILFGMRPCSSGIIMKETGPRRSRSRSLQGLPASVATPDVSKDSRFLTRLTLSALQGAVSHAGHLEGPALPAAPPGLPDAAELESWTPRPLGLLVSEPETCTHLPLLGRICHFYTHDLFCQRSPFPPLWLCFEPWAWGSPFF